jgi:hypothetical protein
LGGTPAIQDNQKNTRQVVGDLSTIVLDALSAFGLNADSVVDR